MESLTVVELKQRAKWIGLRGYSKLCKAELIDLLKERENLSSWEKILEDAIEKMVKRSEARNIVENNGRPIDHTDSTYNEIRN